MPDAKELICRLRSQANAAFWIMPAVILVLAVLPACFDPGGGFRWGLTILMLILSLGLAFWAQSGVGKICASLVEATQLGQVEDEKRRQQMLELQETCR